MNRSKFQMSFDEYDLSSLLTVERIHRAPASVRNNTTDVAGRDGALWRSQRLETRSIEVDIRLIAHVSGRKKQQCALDGLEDLVLGKLYKNDLCKLVLRDRPTRFDLAVLDGGAEFEAEANTRAATLSFLCPSPASYGDWKEQASEGGTVECLVDGNYKTWPTLMVEAAGPFEVEVDGATFEVIGDATGTVIIDAENRATTHDGVVVAVSMFADYPTWQPGVHTVKCDLPFRVGYYERWR